MENPNDNETPLMVKTMLFTNNDNNTNHQFFDSGTNHNEIKSTKSTESFFLKSASDDPHDHEYIAKHALSSLPSSPQQSSQKTEVLTTKAAQECVLHNGSAMSPNQERSKKKIDFLNDDPRTMTISRRIAIYLSRKYQWYNPRLNKNTKSSQESKNHINQAVDIEGGEETSHVTSISSHNNEPSIETAWAYYEHMTLPRRLYNSTIKTEKKKIHKQKSTIERMSSTLFGNKDNGLSFAVPGELQDETRLYSPLKTHISQLGDFGLGVGLYFGTIRAFGVLLVLAGILNIPNILFFSGSEYSDRQQGMNWFLKGSAACNVHEWVPCITCSEKEQSPFTPFEDLYRRQTLTNSDGQEMTFVLKNVCDGAKFSVGMINFGTVLLVILGMILMTKYLKVKQAQFDLDEQTAQDYSITIHNPPKDASDPEEWRDYFKTNFPDCSGMHIASCTVAVDNVRLLHCLTKRRELIEKLKQILPDVPCCFQDLETLKQISDERLQGLNVFQNFLANTFGVPAMHKKIVLLNEEIQKLANKDHDVTSVFVMFETEKAQRHVLEKLTVSLYNIKKNNVNAVSNRSYLFRDKFVLHISEAEEPSTIRWQELHLTSKDLLIKVAMTAIVFAMIVGCVFLVRFCNKVSENYAAMAITILNIVFPHVAKILSKFEKHSREEHLQVWLYFKIAFFRWINTAVITMIIMPFTSTTLPNDYGVLSLVYKIFFAEIITSTVIQFLDPLKNFLKHFVAPRADSQEKMNSYFLGTDMFLAERYANLTKIVFLSVWYCPLYPAVLFLAAVALWVKYNMDRFSIMRTWKPQSKLGTCISHYTESFVFPVTVLVMSFIALWSWEHFRFDYLCETEDTLQQEYYNTTWQLTSTDYVTANTNVTLTQGTKNHKFCKSIEWATSDQSEIVQIYQIFFYVNIGLLCLVLFIAAVRFIKQYFFTTFQPVGDDQKVPLSKVESMSAYIPNIKSSSIPYPLIACNVEQIKNCGLFEWEDPLRPYEYYDLTRDVKVLLRDDGEVDDPKVIFSRMVHWPHNETS